MRATLMMAAACLVTLTPITHAQDSRREQVRETRENRMDQRIAKEVRHELVMLPYYGVFDNLAFRVEGDQVQIQAPPPKPEKKS